MILGVDHIALSCTDIDESADMMNRMGWRVAFTQKNVENHKSKSPVLSKFRAGHDIGYCRSTSGISVELTCHGDSIGAGESPYIPLFEHWAGETETGEDAEGSLDIRDIVGDALAMGNVGRCRWADWVPACWHRLPGENKKVGINAVILRVNNLREAQKFWERGLRFYPEATGQTERGTSWVDLRFSSPTPAWSMRLVIAESASEVPVSYLDSAGFPCMAFLSHDIMSDRKALLDEGAFAVTEPFDLEVNGRLLRVEIFRRGEQGELLELIEVGRRK